MLFGVAIFVVLASSAAGTLVVILQPLAVITGAILVLGASLSWSSGGALGREPWNWETGRTPEPATL